MKATHAYLTPKAFSKHGERLQTQFPNVKFCQTPLVYMNELGGWTTQECDEVCYFVDQSDFKSDLTIRRTQADAFPHGNRT